VILCDVTPRQLLRIAGRRLSDSYKRQLEGFRYGPGVFKVDYALSGPIPSSASECLRAATVHLGGSFEEIAASEQAARNAQHANSPFVLLAQPSLFDPSRAPATKHTAWAYCHVPNGSKVDMLKKLEDQVERFAPGFRECMLARRVFPPAELESMDANLVGVTSEAARWIFAKLSFGRHGDALRPRHETYTSVRHQPRLGAACMACAVITLPRWRSRDSAA
jgi:phytoene dehydrogenase-like protein